jgi:DNA modification methylase
MDKIFGYDNFNNHIIYPYKGGGASHRRFSRKHDDLLFYSKSPDYFYNEVKEKRYVDKSKGYNPYTKQYHDENGTFVMVIPLDVWSEVGYIGHHSKVKSELMNYPTSKNPKLMERIILASSNEGDLVADFFCGSGSFIKKAHELGRSCIGVDVSPKALYLARSPTKRAPDKGNASAQFENFE